MKILLSAFYCEPGQGSESAVGWNFVQQIARFHDVWVVTWGRQQQAIERELSMLPLPNAHFVYVDLPLWRKLWGLGRAGKYAFYYLWQVAAYLAARRLHCREMFDLVHHLTVGGFWYPTLLPFLPVPFVWGPVGTGLPCPTAFHREFSLYGKVDELVRQVVLAVSRLDPIRRHTEKRASVILSVSPMTVGQLRPENRKKAIVLSQVGVDRKEIAELPRKAPRSGKCFRLLSVGRLLHWKGFAVGIKAFALLNKQYPNSEYRIIGDGSEHGKLSELASSLGLSNVVQFLGTVSRKEYLYELLHSDLLVHPGLHEPGAYVIAEAMAVGLPVICLDYGEPASIVTPETGFIVPMSDPERVAADISLTCAQMVANPSLCDRMGNAGRQRISDAFEWEKKAGFLFSIYENVGRQVDPCGKCKYSSS
ncbi:MAG TPA: glycosyltransferase [Terriglobales bacterium]|nr:glycosyltransferase [Terriglobales bacterium]